jgi:hypothetical protein
MRTQLVDTLRSRRVDIRARWADLLRADRASSPLAHPESLVHLIEWTLEEIERALLNPGQRHRIGRGSRSDCRHACDCQRNPLLGYFGAGAQAVREALVLAQAATPHLAAGERDAALEELNIVLHVVAQREIEAFCGLCQYREARVPGQCVIASS